MKEGCICCANGNDLPEGEYCRACGRRNDGRAPSMSHMAWVALGQLAKQPYQDGDLVTKRGRTELIELGLAERVPVYGVLHLMENRLTKAGLELASRFHEKGRGHA